MSALKSQWGKLRGGYPSAVLRSGNGADDETTGCAVESDGEEDHLVGGGRDHRGDGSDDAAVAGTAGVGGVFGAGGPAQRQAQRQEGAAGEGGTGAAAIPGDLLRSEHSAFSREARRGTRHRVELHVGAESTARGWAGSARAETAQAPEAKGAAAASRHAAAHRWQQASVVRR